MSGGDESSRVRYMYFRVSASQKLSILSRLGAGICAVTGVSKFGLYWEPCISLQLRLPLHKIVCIYERLKKSKEEDATALATKIKVHEQSASVCYRVHKSYAKIAEPLCLWLDFNFDNALTFNTMHDNSSRNHRYSTRCCSSQNALKGEDACIF